MANTTFSGPVRSENGFESITKNGTTGAITTNSTYGTDATIGGTVFGSVQALTGAGAVNLTDLITEITAENTGDALTLADGSAGQVKIISYVAESAAGDTAILTPTTLAGGSTITFDSVGDAATLVYSTTSGWTIVGSNSVTVA
jgi:hypothetical protein